MQNVEFADIVCKYDIKNDDELSLLAKKQKNEGQRSLWDFVARHPSPKWREDLINSVQKMHTAEKRDLRRSKSRIDILKEELQKEHKKDPAKADCNGSWLPAALEILKRNNIPRKRFQEWILTALKFGRGKGRNLFLIGGTNSGKTFLLAPLMEIYACFTSPSEGTFNWVGVIGKEIILLNDLRYDGNGVGDHEVLPWQKLLNLLEGFPVNISMPKNFHGKDHEHVDDTPVFITSDREIKRIMGNREDAGESAQLRKRLNCQMLTHQFRDEEVNYFLTPCGRCFAELVLYS